MNGRKNNSLLTVSNDDTNIALLPVEWRVAILKYDSRISNSQLWWIADVQAHRKGRHFTCYINNVIKHNSSIFEGNLISY